MRKTGLRSFSEELCNAHLGGARKYECGGARKYERLGESGCVRASD